MIDVSNIIHREYRGQHSWLTKQSDMFYKFFEPKFSEIVFCIDKSYDSFFFSDSILERMEAAIIKK